MNGGDSRRGKGTQKIVAGKEQGGCTTSCTEDVAMEWLCVIVVCVDLDAMLWGVEGGVEEGVGNVVLSEACSSATSVEGEC